MASQNSVRDVMIIVDCDSILNGPRDPTTQILMFADPAIVLDGQGTSELSIQVNNQDIIRWFVFPKRFQVQGSEDTYSVLAVRDYASGKLLTGWMALQGNGKIWTYKNSSQPLSDSTDLSVQQLGDFKPYVQATAALPDRPSSGESQRESYYFYLNIYKGDSATPAVKDYSWDPYVTVVQP